MTDLCRNGDGIVKAGRYMEILFVTDKTVIVIILSECISVHLGQAGLQVCVLFLVRMRLKMSFTRRRPFRVEFVWCFSFECA